MNKLLLLLLLPVAGFAQEPLTKVVNVHIFPAEKIANMLAGIPNVAVRGDNLLDAVILRGTPASVAQLEQTIKELDRASSPDQANRDIEVTIYLLSATDKLQANGPLGRELAPVVKQLAAAFPYTSYAAAGTVVLRSRNDSDAKSEGALKAPGENAGRNVYSIQYHIRREAGTAGAISLNSLRFDGRFNSPNGSQTSAGLDTSIDIQPGQKVVVGKTNIDSGESALFIVLSARVLE